MEPVQIVFYAFATVLVLASLAVVTARNPVFSVLFLVLAFFTSAGIWLLLEAEFLAITLVLVYVGAVMVLFLFVVMMLDINVDQLREGFARYLPVGAIVGLIILVQMAIVLGPEHFGIDRVPDPVSHGPDYSNTKALGNVLYTDYVFPFELASVILLVAIVAAIALTLRRRPENKAINAAEQIKVKRADRIKLIAMAAEKDEQAEG